MIRTLTRDNFEAETAAGLVVVDYWAPWCAPCRALLPVLEDLAREFSGRIVFGKLNVDDDSSRAVAAGVRGVPTLVFLKDGREVDRVVGIESHAGLRKRLRNHAGEPVAGQAALPSDPLHAREAAGGEHDAGRRRDEADDQE